jgi:chemotaxis protein histidine kinase CheA
MSMMVHILQADPRLMQDFLKHALADLDQINHALKSGSASANIASSNVDTIFRIAHRIKGDATALNLQSVAQSMHAFEEVLSGLRGRSDIHNEDLLPIIVHVKSIYAELNAITDAMARIAQVRGVVHVEPVKPVHNPALALLPFVKQWRSLVEQVAQRHGKQVELNYQGLDLEQVAPGLREPVNTIVNQFIRNAVTHGLETPQARRERGKSEAGHISVYVSDSGDGSLELSFRDDGAGIHQQALREAAVRCGKLDEKTAAESDLRQLTALIFEPGFSTREKTDEDAGRGVGLDVVKSLITQLHGRIRIGTTQGEYCHFRVQLPMPLSPQPPRSAQLANTHAQKDLTEEVIG